MKKLELDALVNLSARRGIILPAFSIYGELAGFYDYGPIGTRIKQNIVNLWRKRFITELNNLEMESTMIAPSKVFEASGHLKSFIDPLVVCAKCKTSHRVDKLLENLFIKEMNKEMAEKVSKASFEELERVFREKKIACPNCKADLSKLPLQRFNLMLKTKIGALEEITGYLRPETAQGMFMNFKSLYRLYALKLPIAVGQTGKVFRNEISPRNALLRLREFSQLELEYFFDPEDKDMNLPEELKPEKINLLSRADQESKSGKEYASVDIKKILVGSAPNKLLAYIINKANKFLIELGFPEELTRFREMLADELPHYSKGNFELEVKLGEEWLEVGGIAYRTDFDIKNHAAISGEDLSVMHNEKKLIPHVIELSIGVDRPMWILLANSIFFDDKRGWELLMLNENVAPYKYTLFPLQKDEKLTAVADSLQKKLRDRGVSVYYSASGSIGKRYARSDEIGIPYAITVDYQTLEDNTVTIRNRDDTKQERKKIEEIS